MMERAAALKKLSKLIGKGLGWRIDPKAPNADERAEAKQRLPELHAAMQAAKAARDARYRLLLEDPEYQRLRAEHEAAKEAHNVADYHAHHKWKFTVGKSNGMFFHVMAQGDSWEDVIRKIEEDKR